MQCPKCRYDKQSATGTLELVRAFNLTINDDGFVNQHSTMVLDEYLSCSNCKDTNCHDDCVEWHWEEAPPGTRRIILEL